MPNDDSTDCVPCPSGQAGTLGICIQCPDGEAPNEARTACLQCSVGTAGEGGVCIACPPTSIASSPGQSGCDVCIDGETANDLRDECVRCPGSTAGSEGSCGIDCQPMNQVPNPQRTGCETCVSPLLPVDGHSRCGCPVCGYFPPVSSPNTSYAGWHDTARRLVRDLPGQSNPRRRRLHQLYRTDSAEHGRANLHPMYRYSAV